MMALDLATDVDALASAPLFRRLPRGELESIVRLGRHRRYARGATIFHPEDSSTDVYLILGGLVKIAIESPLGRQLTLDVLSAGRFFGEVALVDSKPRYGSAVAVLPTRCLLLRRAEILDLVGRHRAFAEDLAVILCERLRDTVRLLSDSVFLDLNARLAKTLLHLAEANGVRGADGLRIELGLTQSDLASLVGASRQQVNQRLSTWQAEEVISISRDRIIIFRPDVLNSLPGVQDQL